MDLRVRLPGALYRRARQRAEAQASDLQTVIRRLLTLYADAVIDPLADDPIATAIGRRGGQARAGFRTRARSRSAGVTCSGGPPSRVHLA